MAWLSGLTGKAENFLNSLDQTAAKVLHEQEAHTKQTEAVSSAAASSYVAEHTPYLSQKPLTPSQSVPSKLFDYKKDDNTPDSSNSSPKTKPDTQSAKKKVDKDEALFEFLNSSDPVDRRKSTPANSARHSRQSSASSVISNKSSKVIDIPSSTSTSGSSMVHLEMPGVYGSSKKSL